MYRFCFVLVEAYWCFELVFYVWCYILLYLILYSSILPNPLFSPLLIYHSLLPPSFPSPLPPPFLSHLLNIHSILVDVSIYLLILSQSNIQFSSFNLNGLNINHLIKDSFLSSFTTIVQMTSLLWFISTLLSAHGYFGT